MRVGDVGPEMTAPPLTIEHFVRYQGASGDFNPIHYDTAFAQAAGFPTPFAVGMHQASRLASWLSSWVGVENIKRFSTQFREQAWPGDVLTYSGVISQVDDATAQVEMTVLRQTGGVHIKGSATIALPPQR
jgi:acyl dehydratase